MQKIENYESYNSGMAKSMADKTSFFIETLKRNHVEVLVDFGCADGVMIAYLKKRLPNVSFIGYDYDVEMLKLAYKRNPDCYFTNSFTSVQNRIKGKKSAISIISTIHEVYSYGTVQSVDEFWDRIYNSGFTYILIRDMLPHVNLNRKAEDSDVDKLFHGQAIHKLFKRSIAKQLYEYERLYGRIESNKDMVHFLYKYTYTDNWKRELHENYFMLTIQDMLKGVDEKYNVELLETYVPYWLRKRIFRDFDIRLKYETHAKIILKVG